MNIELRRKDSYPGRFLRPLLLLVICSAVFLIAEVETVQADPDEEEAGVLDQGSQMSCVVRVVNPLVKVFKDEKLAEELTGATAEISTARNEYENFQLILRNNSVKALKNVDIRISDLVSERKRHRIAAENITIKRVGYVTTMRPFYPVERVGEWPDPLMDFEPFDLPNGEAVPIWFTVYTPKETPAGDYSGEVVIKPQRGSPVRVKVSLRVWDFTLPEPKTFKMAMSLWEFNILEFYEPKKFPSIQSTGGHRISPEMRKRWHNFLIDYYIAPLDLYDGLRDIETAKQIVRENLAHKKHKFNIIQGFHASTGLELDFNTPRWKRRLKFIEEFRRFLKEKNLYRYLIYYSFDEPSPANYPKMKEIISEIKKVDGDAKFAVTVGPSAGGALLYGSIDIWIPAMRHFLDIKGFQAPPDAEALINKKMDYSVKRRLAAGDEVWWYHATGIAPPFPTPNIDTSAVDCRIIPWMSWEYGFTGYLYWVLNHYRSNSEEGYLLEVFKEPEIVAKIKQGKRWPEIPWNTFTVKNAPHQNGGGAFVYPGPGGRPLSSIRLEAFRDGVEDYEYLNILKTLCDRLEKHDGRAEVRPILKKAGRLLTIDPGIAKNCVDYNKLPGGILQRRKEIGEYITYIKEYLAQDEH